jgi:hypothetical protein
MTHLVAPGFVDYIELASQRVTELGWDIITGAIELSARLHTEATEELLSSICVEPNQPQERVEAVTRTELQPLAGEMDRPRPVGSLYSYTAAYPLEKAGHAFGTGRESRVKMTVREANKLTIQGLQADANWMYRRILHAWFYDNSYTYVDEDFGDITCLPLANGDAQEYVKANGDTATDTHFLAQAAAIGDAADPFDDIYDELMEHPENGIADPVVYIPTNLKATVMALASFTEDIDPDIVPGSATDTLRGLPSIPFGDKVLGKSHNCWIVEWKRLPNNYMVAHAPDAEPFIGWRQDSAPELRGFFVESYTDGGVMIATGMIRYSGFAVRQRTAALVYRIGDAAYEPPTGYDVTYLPPSL